MFFFPLDMKDACKNEGAMEVCATVPQSQCWKAMCGSDTDYARKVLEAIALSWESEA